MTRALSLVGDRDMPTRQPRPPRVTCTEPQLKALWHRIQSRLHIAGRPFQTLQTTDVALAQTKRELLALASEARELARSL